MRIAEEAGHGDLIHGQRLRLDLRTAGISFLAQRLYGGDAQYVALQLAIEAIVLQNDIQSLVPGHVIQHDGQRAVHLGIEHYVQAADLVNKAEEIFQVNILQVHRNRLTRVLRTCPASW